MLGIFSAMRVAFEARWIELGYAGVPIPASVVARLRELSRAQARSTVRAHNTAVTRFILGWLTTYAEAHNGSTTDAHAPLIDAIAQWLAQRVDSHGAGMASSMTLYAQSFADLVTGDKSSRYTVEGPEINEQSCATCRHYVGQTLTTEQAWSLTFPAHPHCEHVIRRLPEKGSLS